MTIQTVSLVADLFMLLTAFVVSLLALVSAVQCARRRLRAAARSAQVVAGIVLIYGSVLLAVGLSSGAPRQLKPGDTKCFDDWCVALISARTDAAPGTVQVNVQLQNRGRRAMRSDLARAYLEIPSGGEVAPADGHAIQAMVPPGQPVDLELVFQSVPRVSGVRFVVSEDPGMIGPGMFEIGGEGSPFHTKAGWPL